jgi:organic radical activating enzyme
MKELIYNTTIWEELPVSNKKTLQVFITNNCNLHCNGCFYANFLKTKREVKYMKLYVYYNLIQEYLKTYNINKITLLGGEPTLHPHLEYMIKTNNSFGIETTIYTNGTRPLQNLISLGASVRVGVHGVNCKDKPLQQLKENVPFTLVYMLTKSNLHQLCEVENFVRSNLSEVKEFYISSIRDIGKSGDFWLDTAETLSNEEYSNVVQDFINKETGYFDKIHISTRGTLYTDISLNNTIDHCRFCNILHTNKKITCPLDISLEKYCSSSFSNKQCDKSNKCVLQKIVLKRR